MEAGEVFLRGDYARLIEEGKTDLPEEATSGPYALGTTIMVARASFGADYVLPDVPEWFPARVCLPPPVPGQWYRWYDPFIWFETETAIHAPSEHSPDNMAYIGKLWYPHEPADWYDPLSFWAYPADVWRELFGRAS